MSNDFLTEVAWWDILLWLLLRCKLVVGYRVIEDDFRKILHLSPDVISLNLHFRSVRSLNQTFSICVAPSLNLNSQSNHAQKIIIDTLIFHLISFHFTFSTGTGTQSLIRFFVYTVAWAECSSICTLHWNHKTDKANFKCFSGIRRNFKKFPWKEYKIKQS